MLDQVCCVSNLPQQEGPEDMPLINPKTQNGEGPPAHLGSFAVALFLVLDLRVRETAAQLDELITGDRSNWASK